MPLDPNILLGARGIQLPDPLETAKQGLSLADLSTASQVRQYALKSAQRQDAATQALGQLLPDLLKSNWSAESMQTALQHPAVREHPEIATALLDTFDKRAKAMQEARKSEAAAGKDVAETKAKLLPFITNQAYGLYQKKDLQPSDIAGLSKLIADNGLEHLVQGIPFQTWQNPEGARAGLKQIFNASYAAEKQVEDEETRRKHGVDESLAERKYGTDVTHQKTMENIGWAGINKPTIQATDQGLFAVDSRKPKEAVQITTPTGEPLVKDTGQEKRLDAHVQHLSTALDKDNITGLLSSARNLNKILDKYKDTDLPGVGPLKNALPGPVAAWTLSAEGNAVRSAVKGVTNDLLKLYSGGAVTLSEDQRRTIEQMAGGGFSQEEFYAAWPMIVDRINSAIANKKAGVPEAAVELYTKRGGVSLDPITPAERAVKKSTTRAAAAPSAAAAGGKFSATTPSGVTVYFDDEATMRQQQFKWDQIKRQGAGAPG